MNAYPVTMIDINAMATLVYYNRLRIREASPREIAGALLRWQWACMRLGEISVFRAAGIPHRTFCALQRQGEELDEACG